MWEGKAKRIEREEEKENIWRDKRNIRDQLLSLKFFVEHSTEHQICNTSEITTDRKRFLKRTTASLYLWPICYCEFNCSYPVSPLKFASTPTMFTIL